ncbi:MAG: AAA family ATPase [Methylococcales bacterium]
MIIICGGIKGGGGKTTTAINLAIMRGLAGFEVLLVDADSIDNGNASDFSAIRDETLKSKHYTAIKLNGKAIAKELPTFAKKFNDIVIDVGGHDSISQRASLTVADLLLIPVFPSSFDTWVIESVNTLVSEASLINPKLKAYCFISRADVIGNQNDDTSKILIEDYPEIEFIDCPIRNRKVFRNASSQGLSVIEYKPKDQKAIDELKELYKAVFSQPFN